MQQALAHIALVVKDYDHAIAFYTQKLGFTLLEDTYQPEQDKRWVVIAPANSSGATILLARASTPEPPRPSKKPLLAIRLVGGFFYF